MNRLKSNLEAKALRATENFSGLTAICRIFTEKVTLKKIHSKALNLTTTLFIAALPGVSLAESGGVLGGGGSDDLAVQTKPRKGKSDVEQVLAAYDAGSEIDFDADLDGKIWMGFELSTYSKLKDLSEIPRVSPHKQIAVIAGAKKSQGGLLEELSYLDFTKWNHTVDLDMIGYEQVQSGSTLDIQGYNPPNLPIEFKSDGSIYIHDMGDDGRYKRTEIWLKMFVNPKGEKVIVGVDQNPCLFPNEEEPGTFDTCSVFHFFKTDELMWSVMQEINVE